MEDTPVVRGGIRHRSTPSSGAAAAASSSTIDNFLRTVAPVLLAHDDNVLPSTDTWFEVREGDSNTQSDDKLAKVATKKRKRLGHVKRKRDRIQQEILHESRNDRKLKAQLSAANKRISQLQGAEAVIPTAKEVFNCVCYILFCDTGPCTLYT